MCKGRKRLTFQERQREVTTLAAAQRRVVKQTEARLTPDERQRIEKREIAVNKITIRSQSLSESETNSQGKGPVNKRRRSKKRQVAVNKVSIRSESSNESEISLHGEGPLNLKKGKGVDPRNWGTSPMHIISILRNNKTILESCKLARELAHLPDEDDLDRQQLDDPNAPIKSLISQSARGKLHRQREKLSLAKRNCRKVTIKEKDVPMTLPRARSKPWSIMLYSRRPGVPSALRHLAPWNRSNR